MYFRCTQYAIASGRNENGYMCVVKLRDKIRQQLEIEVIVKVVQRNRLL